MSTLEGTDGCVFAHVALTVPLEEVMRELMPDLLGYFVNRLDDREDAADAVAETLLVLWRKERVVPTDAEDARRYAFGVARKVLQTARRGHHRRIALADRLRAAVCEEVIPSPEIDIELRTALSGLADQDRELILLIAWEGFSVADTSRILGIRPDAARARYSRARARLRETLGATSASEPNNE